MKYMTDRTASKINSKVNFKNNCILDVVFLFKPLIIICL